MASTESKLSKAAYDHLTSVAQANPDLPLEATRALMNTVMPEADAATGRMAAWLRPRLGL
ncbi:MAG TPA: hypothetical protein VL595_00155 [Pseudonocardia sp.]|nr:hypothetical protein [Pseudonocardia sp.]